MMRENGTGLMHGCSHVWMDGWMHEVRADGGRHLGGIGITFGRVIWLIELKQLTPQNVTPSVIFGDVSPEIPIEKCIFTI